MPTSTQRKLDSLARLIEGSHMCAAICVVDNNLYISTNKLTAGSKKRTTDRINTLYSELSKTEFDDESIMLFQLATLEAVKASARGKLTLTDLEIKSLAKDVVLNQGSHSEGTYFLLTPS